MSPLVSDTECRNCPNPVVGATSEAWLGHVAVEAPLKRGANAASGFVCSVLMVARRLSHSQTQRKEFILISNSFNTANAIDQNHFRIFRQDSSGN